MNENLKAFIQKVSEDGELKEKVTAITGSLSDANEELVKIAESYGYSFTAEDIDAVCTGKEKLNDEELLAASGGVMTSDPLHYHGTKLYSTCNCELAGGGCADEYQKHCACVMGGVGELTALGKQKAESGEVHWEGSSGAKVAMWCVLAGVIWK